MNFRRQRYNKETIFQGLELKTQFNAVSNYHCIDPTTRNFRTSCRCLSTGSTSIAIISRNRSAIDPFDCLPFHPGASATEMRLRKTEAGYYYELFLILFAITNPRNPINKVPSAGSKQPIISLILSMKD